MIIDLKNSKVEIKENLTFGDTVKLTKVLGNSSVDDLINAQYALFEILIVKVMQDGKDFKYNKDWVDAQTKEDGELLCQVVNEVVSKKKA